MNNADIDLCYKIIAYETKRYKALRNEGKAGSAENVFQSKTGMERLLTALLAQPADNKEGKYTRLYDE